MRKKNKKLLKQKKNLWYTNHIKKYILSPLDKLLTKLNKPTILTNSYLSSIDKLKQFNDNSETRYFKKENKYILYTVRRMLKRCGSKLLRVRHAGNGPERIRLNLRHLFFANNNFLKENNKFNLNLKTYRKNSSDAWNFELLKKRNKMNSVERDKTTLENFIYTLKDRDLRKMSLLRQKQLTLETSNIYYLLYNFINTTYSLRVNNEKNKPVLLQNKRIINATTNVLENPSPGTAYTIDKTNTLNDSLWNINSPQWFYENWNDIEITNTVDSIGDFLFELEKEERYSFFFIKKWKELIKESLKDYELDDKNYLSLIENSSHFLELFETWFSEIYGKKKKKTNKTTSFPKYLRVSKKFRVVNRDFTKFLRILNK